MTPWSKRCTRPGYLFALAVGLSGALWLASSAIGHEMPTTRAAAELLREKKYEEAHTAYSALLKSNPYDGELWHNLGFTLHSQKR